MDAAQMLAVKRQGFSDRQIAYATGTHEDDVRVYRKGLGVIPVYKTVDTCAAEFEAYTPYYYSTYEEKMRYSRQRSTQGDDSGRRPQPHWPGH
jgi:carbamoyl-phosphate synthase large subunit